MRVLPLFLLASLAVSACTMAPLAAPITTKMLWYQRTKSAAPGMVDHVDASRRFGCLFTASSVRKGQDALMCFDRDDRTAAVWLVGLRPADCIENECAYDIASRETAPVRLRMPVEVVPGSKGVYGLYVNGSTALFDAVHAAGFEYTLRIKTDKGVKAFAFNVPPSHRR